MHVHLGQVFRWRNHRMWLLALESTASLLWVVALAASLIIATFAVTVSGETLFGFAFAWGVAIAIVATFQLLVALWLEHSYDPTILRAFLVAAYIRPPTGCSPPWRPFARRSWPWCAGRVASASCGTSRANRSAPVRIGVVSELRTVRVAAIQATPVILDAEASVAKAVPLLEEAAGGGAELAVLPETFVPLYPSNKWARGAASFGGWDELLGAAGGERGRRARPARRRARRRLRAAEPARRGRRQRARARGTLYNAFLPIGPDGLLHKHRKLMPTQQERLFHGIGAGDDLAPVETPRRPRSAA